MDIAKLIRVADRVDAKGLHSLADQIDQTVCEMSTETLDSAADSKALETLVSANLEPLNILAQVADRLDRRGLTVLADKLDNIIELEALKSQSAIDTVLSIYKEKHKVASVRSFCKQADIRKDNLDKEFRCPFGLSIPGGCQNTGLLVLDMDPDSEEFAKNRKLFQEYNQGQRCPYAENIFEEKDAVNCMWGTVAQDREVPELYRGSPIYPKLFEGFNTVNLDRSYYQYHDFGNYSFYG